MSAATIGTACLLAGCGAGAAAGTDNSSVTESQSGVNGSEQENASSDSQKLQIVATIFPEYDWVKEILGDQADNVDLTLLLGNGTDMHSFQPTMEDILKVSTCDLFIYVGGESDSWVADALKGAGNPDRKAINLMDVLGDQVKEEEIVEGMQDEDGHTHEEEHTHDDDLEYDEDGHLCVRYQDNLSLVVLLSDDAAYIHFMAVLASEITLNETLLSVINELNDEARPRRVLIHDGSIIAMYMLPAKPIIDRLVEKALNDFADHVTKALPNLAAALLPADEYGTANPQTLH